jgi:shikimate kinase
MKIILCGPPLAGKSYYGQKLAEALEWPFLDTDLLIEQRYFFETGEQLACRQIAQKKGLDAFYLLEQRIIADLDVEGDLVIAVGGGALEREANVTKLKQLGTIVYLKAAVPLLLARLKRKAMLPAYLDPEHPEASYVTLIEKRSAAYEKHADLIVKIEEECYG